MEQILAQKPKRKGLGGWEDDEEDVDRNYDPVVASAMEELQAKKRAKKEPGEVEDVKDTNMTWLSITERYICLS